MDHGALGGSFLDEGAMMQAVAGLGLRVLGGEAADTIPIESPNLHVRQVDWRQLRRWGISESRVPVGTIVRFREFSAWDRYGGYVIGAAVLVLAQTLLITGLLVQRNRRRRAEEHARHSEAGLRRSYDRIRDLGSRLLTAQEEERSRIARELHDDISHQIALLTIDLELMRAGPQPGDEHATSAITRASGLARSVHELSHQLHPSKLGLIGLVASLQSLQRELTHAGFAVTFTHANVPSNLPPDLTLCLYRVVQEALQNAVKYSQARNVTVNLSGTPDALTLTIADDGVGFDVDAAWGKGLGLISMSERLEAIGGSLKIRSAPAEGTRLEARVPLMLRTPQDTSTS
jgi:signal transduction histidine kinase